MDQESGINPAEPQVISQPAFISPSDCGRLGPVGGRTGVFSSVEGIDKVGESIAGDSDAGEERGPRQRVLMLNKFASREPHLYLVARPRERERD